MRLKIQLKCLKGEFLRVQIISPKGGGGEPQTLKLAPNSLPGFFGSTMPSGGSRCSPNFRKDRKTSLASKRCSTYISAVKKCDMTLKCEVLVKLIEACQLIMSLEKRCRKKRLKLKSKVLHTQRNKFS